MEYEGKYMCFFLKIVFCVIIEYIDDFFILRLEFELSFGF